ncbi:MAG: baeRF3 domain-containing protein [Syntrophales bacterium]
MNAFSQDELTALMGKHQGLCVSIFMPTYRTGAESQQNPIRFKNLLRTAEEKLLAGGLRPQESKALLESAQALPGNVLFWRRQSDGLALFLSSDLFRSYCLPEPFAELVVVADTFHIKPLLPVLGGDSRFYILALSQKEIRLLEGTGNSVQAIELETLPKSLAEALKIDGFDKQVRFRAGSQSGASGMAMVSGHGGVADDTKDNLAKYFRLIDRGLRDFLKDERAPLVLAGVEYLFPIYREVNTYPCLMEAGIPGSPQGVSTEALHRAALKIVKPFFRKAETDALAQYRQSSGTGLTSTDVREILPAAAHGRIGSLFTAQGRRVMGRFDAATGTVEIAGGAGSAKEDLFETAAIQTFLNGGSVFVLPAERMPAPGDLAAVFRY